MGVALLKGQRGSRGAPVAEGGLHQVRRDEGHLQPPVRRHTSTIVHRHTSSPTTPKPYYPAPSTRATPFLNKPLWWRCSFSPTGVPLGVAYGGSPLGFENGSCRLP